MELIESNRIEVISRVRLRPVALPAEHGGWGLLAEPVALGLLVASSVGGIFIALAALGAFLTRHPLKLALNDWRRGRKSQRTILARRFALLYLSLAVVSFAAALATAPAAFLGPLIIATPAVVIQLLYDSTGRSRALLPELAGAGGIASVVAVIGLAGGLTASVAFALWALMTARAIPTILYLRARLSYLRGKHTSLVPPIAAHVVAVIAALLLFRAGLGSFLVLIALGLLLVRAVSGLFSQKKDVRAKTLGLRELIFGAGFVLATFAGNAMHW
jgi:hypothetical protein